MIRTALVTTALLASLLVTSSVAAQTTPQATPADAAPFLGEWTLNLQGPDRPAVFDFNLKVAEDKVVGEMIAEGMAPQPITDVSTADKNLVLRYMFDYQGNQIAAVVTLTPAADGKITVQIDFAGGAYLMTGTGAKKAPPKQ